MNYKPILIVRLPLDSVESRKEEKEINRKIENKFTDWNILVVYEDREAIGFEAYGAPDLDEITIQALKKKLA